MRFSRFGREAETGVRGVGGELDWIMVFSVSAVLAANGKALFPVGGSGRYGGSG
jgi:hypothetical protein